jgi:hypothetical protein
MPRRRYPYLAFWPDPNLVPEGRQRALAIWLRALAIQHGVLTYDIIVEEAMEDRTSPLHYLMVQPVNVLAAQRRRLIARDKMRAVVFKPSHGPRDQKYRVVVSAMVGGHRQLVPTPWLVRQPELMSEVLARATSFRNAWEQHRINMLALRALPERTRYWKE